MEANEGPAWRLMSIFFFWDGYVAVGSLVILYEQLKGIIIV